MSINFKELKQLIEEVAATSVSAGGIAGITGEPPVRNPKKVKSKNKPLSKLPKNPTTAI